MIQLIPIPTYHYYFRNVMAEEYYPEYRDEGGSLLAFVEKPSRTEVAFHYHYDIINQSYIRNFFRLHLIGSTSYGPTTWGQARMLDKDYITLLDLVQEFIDEIVVLGIIEDTVERIVSNNLEIWEQVGHS